MLLNRESAFTQLFQVKLPRHSHFLLVHGDEKVMTPHVNLGSVSLLKWSTRRRRGYISLESPSFTLLAF